MEHLCGIGRGLARLVLAFTLVGAVEAGTRAEPTVIFPPAGQPSVLAGSITAIGGMNYIGADVSNRFFRFDVDGDSATADSSLDRLRLPTGATVVHAFLYIQQGEYSGMPLPAAPRYPIGATAAATTIGLRTPDGVNHLVTADGVSHRAIPGGLVEHTAWAEVTSLVAPFPAGGDFVVSNIAGQSMDNTWAMYVVYTAPGEPLRNIRLWRVDAYIWGSQAVYSNSVVLSGAPTPAAPAGILIAQGSNGQLNYNGGEFLRIDGQALNDGLNVAGHVWNSSRSEFGVQNPYANPQPITVYDPALGGGGYTGLDLDLFLVDDALTPLTDVHQIDLGTTGAEYLYLHTTALAVEVVVPELAFVKTMTPIGGSPTTPGQRVAVTLTLENLANDTAIGVVVDDPLPAGMAFVPGTLEVQQGGVTTALTDIGGDDVGEHLADVVTVRVGAGATASAGGVLAVGGRVEIRFEVQLDAGLAAPLTLENQGTARFAGTLAPDSPILLLSGADLASPGTPTPLVVAAGEVCECDPTPLFIAINDANGAPAGTVRCSYDATVGFDCIKEADGTLKVFLGEFLCE